MAKKELSIIIPVYNVEKYIELCLKSILQQNKNNLEIILIDDGSTDCSGVICDSYQRKFDNIKVIHQKNQGLSSARNKGIEQSKGTYILLLILMITYALMQYQKFYQILLKTMIYIVINIKELYKRVI